MQKTVALKPRNQQIDAIKFLLILSIFIFHFQKAAGGLYLLCNTYQVEAFFAVSGFWVLRRTKKPFFSTVSNSFKNYLLPWFVWVVIYAVYYTISTSCGVSAAIAIFIKHFTAIRGNGILGMWFTPLFFLISCFYILISKLFTKLFNASDKVLSLIMFALTFLIYFVSIYFVKIPTNLYFSLNHMPKYLFYFALGTLLYNWTNIFNAQVDKSLCEKIVYPLLTVVALLYLAAAFFQKHKLLWDMVSNALNRKLTILPEIFIVLSALISFNFIAKYISCGFISKIGRNTLGLCHGEAFLKSLITLSASLIGLQLKAKTPIEVIIFSIAALVLGCYLILPAVDKITNKLFEKKDKT